jgi:type VI secretion system protein ImpA
MSDAVNDLERFLQPISEAQPAGENLYYAPLYDKIKEARRREDLGPKGVWEEREAKTADFRLVIKLAEDALLTKSKDLQIAAWLTEAWIIQRGTPGLTAGLQLLQALVDRFWDCVYPELDEGDPAPRAKPLNWLGSYFEPIMAVQSIPLTREGKYSWFQYQDSRRVGYEAEIQGNNDRKKVRDLLLKEGKLAPELFDKDVETTKKQFYKDLERDFENATAALRQLDQLCRDKFGEDDAPSFNPLSKTIDEVSNVVHILLLETLKKDPDPIAPIAVEVASSPDEGAAASAATDLGQPAPLAQRLDISELTGEISNASQAILHVLAAAQFLRQKDPGNPVAYLLLRALRWGEVRAARDLAAVDFAAPAPEMRMALRTAAAGKNWKRVLETAETAMGEPSGRGWLDLQRYAIKACDELGYAAAAKALRSELKCLLLDFPDLPKAILNDDTGAANPETTAWLRAEGMIS